MWAKRFPVPEFDRHELKNQRWQAPPVHDRLQRDGYGGVVMNAPDDFTERFQFKGQFLVAVACRLPDREVKISGHSFAWPIERVVITDSLDASGCEVLADWKTPRPMNTRFGPDEGVHVRTAEVYLLIGHAFADHWLGNRVMIDDAWRGSKAHGFRVVSSSETEIDDFHDAVVYFEWS